MKNVVFTIKIDIFMSKIKIERFHKTCYKCDGESEGADWL